MLPDAIEDDCRRSGLRREATLASMLAFTEKVANALGVALVGFVLGWYQRQAPAPGAAIPANVSSAIMTCFGLIPPCFVLASGAWWLLVRREPANAARS